MSVLLAVYAEFCVVKQPVEAEKTLGRTVPNDLYLGTWYISRETQIQPTSRTSKNSQWI